MDDVSETLATTMTATAPAATTAAAPSRLPPTRGGGRGRGGSGGGGRGGRGAWSARGGAGKGSARGNGRAGPYGSPYRRSQTFAAATVGTEGSEETAGTSEQVVAASKKEHGCIVCDVGPPKYKCPTCRSPYCSVACYKSHRAAPCEDPSRDQPPTLQPPPNADLSDDDEKLTSKELELLASSDKIRKLLKDPLLLPLLRKIDGCYKAEPLIEAALDEVEAFGRFAEEAIKLVRPGGPKT
ncbi:hypothetical protein DFJ73DRAFT_51873 [Zopfochytrium polystomum]|nr:hypothetical protein DFJ73DRAFT_51873 [Zopfochytrium polystomum]